MKIVKWFSVLVASGNGSRCNDLKKHLRDELLQTDKVTGKWKADLWELGAGDKDFDRISRSVGVKVNPLFKDVPKSVWLASDKKSLDESPLMLTVTKDQHVLVFRRLIEQSMTTGTWSGRMAALS